MNVSDEYERQDVYGNKLNSNFSTEKQEALRTKITLNVLNYCDAETLQSASRVSHQWKSLSLEAARKKELEPLIKFSTFLYENFNENIDLPSDKRKELADIANDPEIPNCGNLIQVRNLMYRIQSRIVDVCKDSLVLRHRWPEFRRLENISKDLGLSFIFDHMTELVKYNRTVFEFKISNWCYYAEGYIWQILKQIEDTQDKLQLQFLLMQIGRIDPSNEHLVDYFTEMKKGNYDKALDKAKLMEEGCIKGWALYLISRKRAMKGEFNQAIEIPARLIKKDSIREATLEKIALRANKLDEALHAVKSMNRGYERDKVVLIIVEKLAKAGELETARKLIDELMNPGWPKDFAHKAIAKSKRKGKFSKIG